MSQRDLALWARIVAAVLVVIASWWLLDTAVVRHFLGRSVAWLSAGVVTGFVLRGNNVPLGLWPEAATRGRFQPAWVFGVVLVCAGLVVLGNPATSTPLAQALDRGTYVLVVMGAVAWGFSVAFVPQSAFLPWFGAAALAGLAPAVVGGWIGGDLSACTFAMDASDVPCAAGVVQAAAFTVAVSTVSGLVTLELAFRRMLLGRWAGAGLVLVIISAAATAAWFAAVDAGDPSPGRIAWWGIAGLGAASLYACSGSLLVSSSYMGLLAAGDAALRFGTLEFVAPGAPMFAAHAAAALVLAGLAVTRNGVMAGVRSDAPGDEVPPEAEET